MDSQLVSTFIYETKKVMCHVYVSLCTLLFISLFSCLSFAETSGLEGGNSNKNKTTYKVGVSFINSYPLISFANTDDKGMGWAILEAFAKHQGIQFEYVGMPITRLQTAMETNLIDFIFPDNPLWSAYRSNRRPNIYSKSIIMAVSATFVKNENNRILLPEVDKVAIPFGYTAINWITPVREHNIRTVPARSLEAALFSVSSSQATAADVEYNIGKYLIHKHPEIKDLSINPNLPNTPVNYHLSSIKHIDILEALSQFIDANPKLIENLKKQYKVKYHHEVYTSQVD